MKKSLLILVLYIVSVSCSRNVENLEANSKEQRVALLTKILQSPTVQNAKQKNDFNSIQSLVSKEFDNQNLAAPTYHGPYQLIVTQPSPFLKNQKIIYSGPSNYPPPGVYFADLYNYQLKVQIPVGALGVVQSVYTEGYSNYNNQSVYGFNQTTSTENGKYFLIVNTYTMVLKYNSIGQYLGIALPYSPSNSKKFTYGYWTF